MLKFYEDILKPFRELDATVVLFGSVSRDSSYSDSDIDIAVITKDRKVREKARELADSILFEAGKVISLVFFTESEFMARKNYPFENEIINGVVLNDKRKLIERVGGRRA